MLRYLARAYGRGDLYPSDPAKAELVDALMDFEADVALGEAAIKCVRRIQRGGVQT